MLKVNRNVELALKTIEFLKQEEKPVRTRDIAEKIGTTTAFLEQVVRKLRVAGITTPVRGPGGGYKLNRGHTITALNVAIALGYNPKSATGEVTTGLSDTLSQSLTTAFDSVRIDL